MGSKMKIDKGSRKRDKSNSVERKLHMISESAYYISEGRCFEYSANDINGYSQSHKKTQGSK